MSPEYILSQSVLNSYQFFAASFARKTVFHAKVSLAQLLREPSVREAKSGNQLSVNNSLPVFINTKQIWNENKINLEQKTSVIEVFFVNH